MFSQQDLFPGIDCPDASHDELSFAIQYVTAEDGYISLLEQVNICNWMASLKGPTVIHDNII